MSTLLVHTLHTSNTAYHDLCSTTHPPRFLRTLLGLGLNFVVQPRHSTGPTELDTTCKRFRRDFYTKVMFTATDSNFAPGQLFLRSDWEPPVLDIPAEIRASTSYFLKTLRSHFPNRRTHPNLTRLQRSLLQELRNSKYFIVLPADKNLGPCIMERHEYTARALHDHLLDDTIYERLSPQDATDRILTVKNAIKDFIQNFEEDISRPDRKFLARSLDVEDPFAYFYLTAKVHKHPWKTRPIVSHSGSITYGLRYYNLNAKPSRPTKKIQKTF